MRHALIFAAGLGERMRPLTEHTPKPLLTAGGKTLIEWHLEKLADAGVHYVVINTSHLAAQFPETLGDGSRWGLRIRYAYEGPTPLETGGGMLNALPLLGHEPFLAINGDIWCDVDFASLPTEPAGLARLLMVDNPPHHRQGDFSLRQDGQARRWWRRPPDFQRHRRLSPRTAGTLARGRSTWRPRTWVDPPRFKLAPLLRAAMHRGEISGIHHRGDWTDVGTPERLAQLDARLDTGA